MPVDEFHLRTQARELADLYRQLHGLKHAKPTPPEARTSHQPPSPRTPGNWLIISTYIDLEQRLREVAFNAFADTHITLRDGDAAAPRLCHLLAFHAYTVSRLDWANDLLDELGDQARIIRRRITPHVESGHDSQQEIWLTAKTLTYKLKQQGYNITPELLRKWAEREKIRKRASEGKSNLYNIKDVFEVVRLNGIDENS